jgi:hypothetical protein
MSRNDAVLPWQRAQRKQNLLLASRLVRGQLVGAVDELGQGADGVIQRVRQVQAVLTDPRVWLIGSAIGSMFALIAVRRLRSFWLLRWGLLGWRVWKSAAPMLRSRREPH